MFCIYDIIQDLLCHKPAVIISKNGILISDAGKSNKTVQFVGYQEICNEYNKKYKQSNKNSYNRDDKLKTVDVAGYCKKLSRLGLVSILNQRQQNEKLVILQSMKGYWNQDSSACDLDESDFQNSFNILNYDINIKEEIKKKNQQIIDQFIDDSDEIQFQMPSE